MNWERLERSLPWLIIFGALSLVIVVVKFMEAFAL